MERTSNGSLRNSSGIFDFVGSVVCFVRGQQLREQYMVDLQVVVAYLVSAKPAPTLFKLRRCVLTLPSCYIKGYDDKWSESCTIKCRLSRTTCSSLMHLRLAKGRRKQARWRSRPPSSLSASPISGLDFFIATPSIHHPSERPTRLS